MISTQNLTNNGENFKDFWSNLTRSENIFQIGEIKYNPDTRKKLFIKQNSKSSIDYDSIGVELNLCPNEYFHFIVDIDHVEKKPLVTNKKLAHLVNSSTYQNQFYVEQTLNDGIHIYAKLIKERPMNCIPDLALKKLNLNIEFKKKSLVWPSKGYTILNENKNQIQTKEISIEFFQDFLKQVIGCVCEFDDDISYCARVIDDFFMQILKMPSADFFDCFNEPSVQQDEMITEYVNSNENEQDESVDEKKTSKALEAHKKKLIDNAFPELEKFGNLSHIFVNCSRAKYEKKVIENVKLMNFFSIYTNSLVQQQPSQITYGHYADQIISILNKLQVESKNPNTLMGCAFDCEIFVKWLITVDDKQMGMFKCGSFFSSMVNGKQWYEWTREFCICFQKWNEMRIGTFNPLLVNFDFFFKMYRQITVRNLCGMNLSDQADSDELKSILHKLELEQHYINSPAQVFCNFVYSTCSNIVLSNFFISEFSAFMQRYLSYVNQASSSIYINNECSFQTKINKHVVDFFHYVFFELILKNKKCWHIDVVEDFDRDKPISSNYFVFDKFYWFNLDRFEMALPIFSRMFPNSLDPRPMIKMICSTEARSMQIQRKSLIDNFKRWKLLLPFLNGVLDMTKSDQLLVRNYRLDDMVIQPIDKCLNVDLFKSTSGKLLSLNNVERYGEEFCLYYRSLFGECTQNGVIGPFNVVNMLVLHINLAMGLFRNNVNQMCTLLWNTRGKNGKSFFCKMLEKCFSSKKVSEVNTGSLFGGSSSGRGGGGNSSEINSTLCDKQEHFFFYDNETCYVNAEKFKKIIESGTVHTRQAYKQKSPFNFVLGHYVFTSNKPFMYMDNKELNYLDSAFLRRICLIMMNNNFDSGSNLLTQHNYNISTDEVQEAIANGMMTFFIDLIDVFKLHSQSDHVILRNPNYQLRVLSNPNYAPINYCTSRYYFVDELVPHCWSESVCSNFMSKYKVKVSCVSLQKICDELFSNLEPSSERAQLKRKLSQLKDNDISKHYHLMSDYLNLNFTKLMGTVKTCQRKKWAGESQALVDQMRNHNIHFDDDEDEDEEDGPDIHMKAAKSSNNTSTKKYQVEYYVNKMIKRSEVLRAVHENPNDLADWNNCEAKPHCNYWWNKNGDFFKNRENFTCDKEFVISSIPKDFVYQFRNSEFEDLFYSVCADLLDESIIALKDYKSCFTIDENYQNQTLENFLKSL